MPGAPRVARPLTRGRLGDPRQVQGLGFERPPITELDATVVGVVREYVERLDENLREGRGLWLMGDVGTGKTSLAMLVSKAALEHGRSVAIYSLPRLLARIRRTYDAEAGEQSYLEFFERLTAVDLLHVDDLGVEKRSDWVLEQLYALVDERYESQRSIVVTTNLDQAEPRGTDRRPDRLAAGRGVRRSAAPVRRRPALPGRRLVRRLSPSKPHNHPI